MAEASLAAFIEQARAEVDEALDRWLPQPPAAPQIIAEAMRYSVFAGGKRLRPVLALAAAEAVAARQGGNAGEALTLVARHEGIVLDPVYTAKAMAGLIGHIRRGGFPSTGTVLFWHTGGQVGLFA